MEKIKFLTHVTNQSNKEKIQKEGALRGYKEQNPKKLSIDDLPLRQHGAPTGVWFAASLFQGDLPTKSPFGTERLKVPIEDICIDKDGEYRHLFLEGKFSIPFEKRNRDGVKYTETVNYVRLAMCSETNENISRCRQTMEQLDISNNRYLKLDRENGYHAVMPTSVGDRTYVHVFVLSDRLILGNWEWDKVEILKSNYNL